MGVGKTPNRHNSFGGGGTDKSEQGFLPEIRLRSLRFGGKNRASRACRKSQRRATGVGFGKGVCQSLLEKWEWWEPQLGQRQA